MSIVQYSLFKIRQILVGTVCILREIKWQLNKQAIKFLLLYQIRKSQLMLYTGPVTSHCEILLDWF